MNRIFPSFLCIITRYTYSEISRKEKLTSVELWTLTSSSRTKEVNPKTKWRPSCWGSIIEHTGITQLPVIYVNVTQCTHLPIFVLGSIWKNTDFNYHNSESMTSLPLTRVLQDSLNLYSQRWKARTLKKKEKKIHWALTSNFIPIRVHYSSNSPSYSLKRSWNWANWPDKCY